MSMQRWYSITAEEIIPAFLWWILGGVASLASLFVMMSYLLRREVRRKTAELARQNEELVRKNEELRAAYDQLTAMDEELKDNFYQLRKSESALIQARKKLNLLHTLIGQDIRNAFFNLAGFIQISKESESFDEAKVYFGKEEEILHSVQENLSFLEKYQNLGINQPRWQNFVYVLLSAISHLDLSHISRTIDLPNIEIFTDPLLEDAFLALMDTIARQGDQITRIGLSCQKNADTITIIIESDGPGIPANEKEQVFKWEYMGKNGTSLFLAREIAQHRDYSEQTAQLIDKEVHEIVTSCRDRAITLIEEHADKFELIATNLIERETLNAQEIELLMKGEPLPPIHNGDSEPPDEDEPKVGKAKRKTVAKPLLDKEIIPT
ncbi:MAG: ATP-dependent metalloprotease [Euryarchaeota archaeon ADurb.Bin294]|nr:MAG: ATP-dependent metalloprotease [Euryarchaeota archaeon ADurb.Bin294]